MVSGGKWTGTAPRSLQGWSCLPQSRARQEGPDVSPSLCLLDPQPPTVVCEKWKLSWIMYTLHAHFLNVWHRFACSVGGLLTKFLHRSSVGSALRVRCWLGKEKKERLDQMSLSLSFSLSSESLCVCALTLSIDRNIPNFSFMSGKGRKLSGREKKEENADIHAFELLQFSWRN